MQTSQQIEAKLRDAFSPSLLEVIDESEQHRGHGGWREGGQTHFRVRIVSASFEGKSRVDRQRAVHAVLHEELAGPVHALALEIGVPTEQG
ncbi:MAG: BolA family transcriptional regulator [Neomegalonema sp.]|nr:BolA family transcriptional regulator [Neomegalonema sp.]